MSCSAPLVVILRPECQEEQLMFWTGNNLMVASDMDFELCVSLNQAKMKFSLKASAEKFKAITI